MIDSWVDAISAHNHGSTGTWSVRFRIDDEHVVEQTVKRLEAVGAAMSADGAALEYVATFPSVTAREVATILVDVGAWICSNQP